MFLFHIIFAILTSLIDEVEFALTGTVKPMCSPLSFNAISINIAIFAEFGVVTKKIKISVFAILKKYPNKEHN